MTKIKLLVNLEDKNINETLFANEIYDFTTENGFLKVYFPSGKHYTLISEEYKGKFFEFVEVEEVTTEAMVEVMNEITQVTNEVGKNIRKSLKKSGGKSKNEII